MSIMEWPETERPREKLLENGARSLSDAELLAVLLRTGAQGKNVVELCRELLTKYGGLRNILNAEHNTLCASPGLGSAKFAILQASLELGKRYSAEKLVRHGKLTSPRQVSDYLMGKLRDYQHEVFAVIYLDNRHQIIQYEELFHGTINSASVYPREVVKRVLAHNAAAIIIAHNHPSGVAEPSNSDTTITRKLRDALALVDVRVLDHLVVGDGCFVSLSERGLL